ncbi:MAG TPA: TIM barrel protein [Candidatus Baltobacteraceae bacterium]|nr:TIM barrel protein [Candidatus Baltobacteraceae bacterium]
MKLACSSTAFDEQLRSQRLTQLEWIDLCAHELAADGVVFDVRHFPRTDTDYLAQIKKMAVDLGLSVAALRHDGFFDAGQARMEQAVEMALALGAPLLCAPLPPETQESWTQVQARLGEATSIAKRFNVTLALRNVPHTHAATTHDMKRVSKEADSAWLRYGPDLCGFDAASRPQELLGKCVLAWYDARRGGEEVRETARLLAGFRGFLVLDDGQGTGTIESIGAAMRAWNGARVLD